jgi:predicted GTPase
MTTTAKALLNIMTVRLDLQNRGISHPQPSMQLVTQQLVDRLSKLEPNDCIDIKTHTGNAYAQYIHVATGEVLAEIREADAIHGNTGME